MINKLRETTKKALEQKAKAAAEIKAKKEAEAKATIEAQKKADLAKIKPVIDAFNKKANDRAAQGKYSALVFQTNCPVIYKDTIEDKVVKQLKDFGFKVTFSESEKYFNRWNVIACWN
jgi:cytochrome oxidase Cu insertion factor (SCO1/SenC/PrrC family)